MKSRFARKILDAMPDGIGAVMIDGKMQDDATWKQAKVVVDLARLVAGKDPDLAARYGFDGLGTPQYPSAARGRVRGLDLILFSLIN